MVKSIFIAVLVLLVVGVSFLRELRHKSASKVTEVTNKNIAGWRVKSKISQGCHIFDAKEPDEYRSVTIPEGTLGSLTGHIRIYSSIEDIEKIRDFALDSDRIKDMLRKHFSNLVDVSKSYWREPKKLNGEDSLASKTSLVIKWDGIFKQEPDTLECGSYIPWLELVE